MPIRLHVADAAGLGHMITRLRKFLSDRSASYGPMFALLIVPLFGTAATAVEYSRIFEVRSNLQQALDASALATAKELSENENQEYLSQYARDYFDSNLSEHVAPSEVGFTFAYVTNTSGASTVKLTAQYNYKTVMAGVVGIYDMPMAITAEVAASNKTVEVAIVIDNSGSMSTYTGSTSQTRLEVAKSAATDLVSALHTVASFSNKPDPIKIAVVPFAGSVNVGAKYRGAGWLDMYGWSSIHHENLDWTGTSSGGDTWPGATIVGDGVKSLLTSTVSVGPSPPLLLPSGIVSFTTNWLSRWTLYDTLGVDWAGCVEMRPWPYSTTDDEPTELTPDTLYVPMFAPDEPERVNSSEDNDYRNRYLDDYVRPGPDYAKTSANYGSYSKQLKREYWTGKYNSDALLTDGSGNPVMGKTRSSNYGDYGPNMGCTTQAIQELTTDKQTAIDAINAMQPGGYTNVQAGFAWGWRSLSSTAPFTEGRPYTSIENDKYLIILTDGNNTYPGQSTQNDTEYYSWGYGKDDRVHDGADSWLSDVGAMDQHTETTCANIKAIKDADNEPAVKIFTIAYDVPDGSSVKALLYNCASVNKKGQRYYYDVSGDALSDAMTAIGNEISDLRIIK